MLVERTARSAERAAGGRAGFAVAFAGDTEAGLLHQVFSPKPADSSLSLYAASLQTVEQATHYLIFAQHLHTSYILCVEFGNLVSIYLIFAKSPNDLCL